MVVLEFIFFLGAAFIAFGFFWGILRVLFTALSMRAAHQAKPWELWAVRLLSHYILVSIAVLKTYDFVEEHGAVLHPNWFIAIGMITTSFYLIGKLKQTRVQLQLNALRKSLKGTVLPRRQEGVLVLVAIVFYVVSIQFSAGVQNNLIRYFVGIVTGLVNMPVVGWIIKIAGFFFTVNFLFNGVQMLLNFPQEFFGKDEEDEPEEPEFDPFELVEDENEQ